MYQQHTHVFSEQEAQRFPGPRTWDHAIELKPDAPPMLPGKVYVLTQDEQKALHVKTHYYTRSDGLIQAQGSAGVPKVVYN